MTSAALLAVRDLVHQFHTDGGVVQAVSGVSFDVFRETLGIVGETGSGKSTLAPSVLQAPRPTSGSVAFRGTDLTTLRGTRLLAVRRHLQMVFQDPFGSLDPKWAVQNLVEEPLIAYRSGGRAARRQRVDEVLELVGLDPAVHGRRRPRSYPAVRPSGWPSPGRWRCPRRCSSATSRSPPWTCSSRPRCSTCSSNCAPSSACPTCSSRTTWPW